MVIGRRCVGHLSRHRRSQRHKRIGCIFSKSPANGLPAAKSHLASARQDLKRFYWSVDFVWGRGVSEERGRGSEEHEEAVTNTLRS